MIDLLPTVAVSADQAWFWTERWQRRERQVDAHVAAGDNTDDFLGALSAVSANDR